MWKFPEAWYENTTVKAVDIHQFADASSLACSTAAVAVINQGTMNVKGLLASKSRISKRNTSIARLELISGHMTANLAKNLCQALKEWPIRSVTIWMDSMVALYWISNPGKSWKIFVANRVRKIARVSGEVGIQWKYCPSEMNLADLGSREPPLAKWKVVSGIQDRSGCSTKKNGLNNQNWQALQGLKRKSVPLTRSCCTLLKRNQMSGMTC